MTHDLEDTLDSLAEQARRQGDGQLTLGALFDTFGHRPAGTLLLVPALVMISPLGAVPLVPTFTAAVVLLVAVQLLFAQNTPWLPGFLRKRGLEGMGLIRAVDRGRPVARLLDRLIRPRLAWVVGPVGRRGIALLCAALSLLTPPLELLPFAVLLPGAAMVLLSLALIGQDGLLAMVGGVLATGGVAVAAWGLS